MKRKVLKESKISEVVHNFPNWAIYYAAYGESDGLDDEEVEMIDKFMDENGYSHISKVIEGSENDFVAHPAFGLGCDTSDVIMMKKNINETKVVKENKGIKMLRKRIKESRRANDGLVETLQLTYDFVSNNYDEVEEVLDSIKRIDVSKIVKNFYDFFVNEDYGTAWEMLDSRLAIVAGKDKIPENYVPNEDDDFFPYQIALKDMRHDDMPDYEWLDQPLYNEDDVYDTEMIYKECPSLNEIERSVLWIIGEYGEYIEKLKELYDDFYEEQWGSDEDNPEEDLPKEKYFSLPRDLGIDDSNISEDKIKEAIREYLYMDYHDLYPNYWVKSIDIDVDRYGKSVRADIHWANGNEDLEECNNRTKLRESIKRKFRQRVCGF